MNALSEFMGLMLLPSPPSLAIDMSTAVLNDGVSAVRHRSGLWSSRSRAQFFLQDEGEELRGFFLLLPDAASLQAILRAVRVL